MGSPDDLWPPFSRGHGGSRGRVSPRERQHRSPSLSRGEIVDAAIAVADAEGASAISMRRIAQVLRAGTMSLYWHVDNKEHLLDLMLDTVLGETTLPDGTTDWRSALRAIACSERAVLHRHRWVMDFIGGRPPLGPHVVINLERSMAALDSLQLDTATVMNVLGTVNTYVVGSVLRELREMRAQRDLERSGFDEAELMVGMSEWKQRLRADGRFRHFLRIIEDNVDPDAADTRDARFEFGLDCLLDGIAIRLQPTPVPTPTSAPTGPILTSTPADPSSTSTPTGPTSTLTGPIPTSTPADPTSATPR